MTIELVVDRAGDTLALAIVDQGALVDLWSVDAGPDAVEDRLFLARVTGIEPAVDGAFLDHGGAQPGYITGKDARFRRGLSKKVSIRHCLEDGEWLVVQGLRAAEGDKGARFTTDLRLHGPHLVYRPYDDEITAAQAFAARAEHEHLREPRGIWRVPAPGARAALSALVARGILLGVVSNADGRVERQLALAHLRKPFGVVVDSLRAGVEKPAPTRSGHPRGGWPRCCRSRRSSGGPPAGGPGSTPPS